MNADTPTPARVNELVAGLREIGEWGELPDEVNGHFFNAAADALAALERDNHVLRLKTANSLANNLCPDHRDKQGGKPCLACEIERLSRERDELRSDLDECLVALDEVVGIHKLRWGDRVTPDRLSRAIELAGRSADIAAARARLAAGQTTGEVK